MNPTIRCLTVADIPSGMRLKDQNGWNTRPEDWRRQLELEPEGCFAAELDGQVIGTACGCIFESVAWINLVLVDRALRGRGIGTALMRTVLAWLEERGVPSIRLDATPLGRPIYEKLGFVAEHELTRYEGIMPALPVDADAVTLAAASDLPLLAEFDQRITGTNRAKLLGYLHRQLHLYVMRQNTRIMGYAALRPGSRSRHIGPCLGEAPACRNLFAAVSQVLCGESVYMDIPAANAEANELAAQSGMKTQRRLTRMGRGVRVHENLEQLWCSFGPEKG